MKTPVVLLIYKRPDLVEQVLAEVAAARPETLLVVADGPATEDDVALCSAARRVLERVDWPCDVRRFFAEKNMGCKARIASGLNWAFQNVDRAIILEEDCLPDATFFSYAEELLDVYETNDRVMHISAYNFQDGRHRGNASYYFSQYVHVWGWATWRRAWQCYDVNIQNWESLCQGSWLRDRMQSTDAESYWRRVFDSVLRDEIDTWDYQWLFACWLNNGVGITPNVNLVSNIGLDERGAHALDENECAKGRLRESMPFPLQHPREIEVTNSADRYTEENHYGITRSSRLWQLSRRAFRAIEKGVFK